MVLAEDLRQAVLQAALQGKLTEQLETDSDVDEALNSIKAKKEELIIEKKLKREKDWECINEEEMPFIIPVNWKWVHLGEVIYFLGGYAFKSTSYVKDSKNQVVRLGNVKDNKLILDEKQVYVSDQTAKNAENFEIKENDILVTMTGTRHKQDYLYTAKVDANDLKSNRLYLNQRVGCFRILSNVSEDYLCFVLQNQEIKKIIFGRETGTANQGNIGAEDIKEYVYIPLPPIEEQQRIVEKINEIMPKIDEYEKIEKELDALKKEFPTDMKDALLQAAMQGKLTEQLESDSSVDEFNMLEDDDYPYAIPANWRFVELGDLTSIPIKRGKSPKYTDKSGILVFAQKCNQKIGKISLGDAKYLDENIKHKYEQENYLQGNDIVINSTGGGTLGRIGYISEELIKHSLPIVPDSHITTIRTKDNVLPRYIYFFLKFNQSYLETMGVGSTNQTELRPDTIKELLVPLPPIEEQKRIVERLDALLHCVRI